MDPSTSTASPAGPSFSLITPLGSPQMESHTQQAQAHAEPIQQQQHDDDLFVPGIGEPDDLLERIEPPSKAPIWPVRGKPTGAIARRARTTHREPFRFENEEASSQ